MPDRERDERFHLQLEDIKEFAVFRVDPEGRIASWNEGARRVKGYEAHEAIGQPFAMLFTPEQIQEGRPAWEMRMAREKGVFQEETVRVRKSGERFDAEVTLRPLADEQGVHRGFVKVTRDISQRKRIEQELKERAEFEQQLIGIVSHDLRTPISAITLGAALLLRSKDLGPRHVSAVSRILTSSERAHRLISSLLDFTQARAGGGLPLQYHSVDLSEFVSLTVEEVRLVHSGRDIQLETSGEVRGEWDPDRVAQLVTNLLNNALAHGVETGAVRLRVQAEPESVRLTVHNQGQPIPPETLPRLFEPLQRGGGADRNSGSIGLGLYIVKQIVLAHGGTVDVHSSLEEGTTFTVRLPRHPPPREAAKPLPG
jgi:PAS domain S-box-containing protein